MKILTFDVEDWFHILDYADTESIKSWGRYTPRVHKNVEQILELLEQHRQTATFFCLGWVAAKHPEIIKMIDEAGHEIGSHSFAHGLVYQQTQRAFEADLHESMSTISEVTGKAIDCYRAPGFSITESTPWAFDSLSKAGIEVDCSIFPASRAHGGISRFESNLPTLLTTSYGELKCLPINTWRVCGKRLVYSGGGYFRLLPKLVLRYRFDRDPYIMTYFHPRDFDFEQPILSGLPLHRKFKSYVGLRGAKNKLSSLLKDHDFMNVSDAVRSVNWQLMEKVDVSDSW